MILSPKPYRHNKRVPRMTASDFRSPEFNALHKALGDAFGGLLLDDANLPRTRRLMDALDRAGITLNVPQKGKAPVPPVSIEARLRHLKEVAERTSNPLIAQLIQVILDERADEAHQHQKSVG